MFARVRLPISTRAPFAPGDSVAHISVFTITRINATQMNLGVLDNSPRAFLHIWWSTRSQPVNNNMTDIGLLQE